MGTEGLGNDGGWVGQECMRVRFSRRLPLLLFPLQAFTSLSSSTEKASAIVSQIVGGAAGETHDFGELKHGLGL